jgi:hypothetical protein
VAREVTGANRVALGIRQARDIRNGEGEPTADEEHGETREMEMQGTEVEKDIISHPAYEIRKRKRVWTVVHKGSGLATDAQTDLNRGANDDVTVTNVKRKGEKMARIINVYDQRDVQTGERRVRE